MARKSDDSEVVSWLIVIAVILAPFIWLYNAVGPFWFWVFVIGVPVLVLAWWFAQELVRAKASVGNPPVFAPISQNYYETTDDGFESAWIGHCEKIEQAWRQGDFDWARKQLQKIAYTMVGGSVTQDEKNRFTRVMTEFAKEDPLYNAELRGRTLADGPA